MFWRARAWRPAISASTFAILQCARMFCNSLPFLSVCLFVWFGCFVFSSNANAVLVCCACCLVACSLEDWLSAAETFLALEPSTAAALFAVFKIMAIRDGEAAHASVSETGDAVHTQPFLLFLLVQLFHVHTRTRASLHGVDYPMPAPAHYEERSHFDFVLLNLVFVVRLVSSIEGRVSREDFDALAFLLAAGPHELAESRALSDTTPFWSSNADPISEETAVDFLRHNLIINTTLYPYVAYRASPAPTMDEVDAVYSFANTARDSCPPVVARNLQPPLIYSDLDRKTVVKIEDALAKPTSLCITRCKHGFLYLLAPFDYVTIYGCKNLTIVVGAVRNIIRISRCVGLRVIVACRLLSVKSSISCQVNLYSPHSPLLRGRTGDISLAPYNTFYPLLESHLAVARLDPKREGSQWLKPITVPSVHAQRGAMALSGSGSLVFDSVGEESAPWRIVPPAEFSEFVIPIAMDGPTSRNPVPLLAMYKTALSSVRAQAKKLHESISHAALSAEALAEYKSVVHNAFSEWLRSAGRVREVRQLMIVAQAENADELNSLAGSETERSQTLPPSTVLSSASEHPDALSPRERLSTAATERR